MINFRYSQKLFFFFRKVVKCNHKSRKKERGKRGKDREEKRRKEKRRKEKRGGKLEDR